MAMQYFLRKKIEKNLRRKSAPKPVSFRTALILADAHSGADKTFVRKISEILGIPYENIDVLYLDEKNPHPDFLSVMDIHIGWNGKIKEPNVRKFLDKNYDLLLDLSSGNSLCQQYISSSVQSGFRVGVREGFEANYDLVIEKAKADERFLEELKKYFKALNFL
jgi:hypothetical protein